jgi:hypothetical protein
MIDYSAVVVPAEVDTSRLNPRDPQIQEIRDICAVHKAELMHLSISATAEYERVKCFELHGYAVQTAVWDKEPVEHISDWVDSQWVSSDEVAATVTPACAADSNTTPDLAPGLWLMDTGCAHDLINKSMATGYDTSRLSSPFAFVTANGRTLAYQSVPMYSQAMGGRIDPFLLNHTPAVLSIGKRCMEEGYSFIWKANETPYLETPSGACISLRVERNIPYLDARDDPSQLCQFSDAAVPVAVADEADENDVKEEEDMLSDEDGNPVEHFGEDAGDPSVKEEKEEMKLESKVTSKLREEATSHSHKLTHLPKNPFCDACQRGKMKEKYSHRGAFKRELTKWGEVVTLDYLHS